ncbi:MAG: hypothetical protein ACLFQK_09580 [Fibrobacterota bacterium]
MKKLLFTIALFIGLFSFCGSGESESSDGRKIKIDSDGPLGSLPEIAAAAYPEYSTLLEKAKDYESKAAEAMRTENIDKTTSLLKKSEEIKQKASDLSKNTVEKMRAYIKNNGGAIQIPFEQKGSEDKIKILKTEATGAVWNPRSYPHVNLECLVEANINIKPRRIESAYIDKTGDTLHTGRFLGLFNYKKLTPGDTARLRANPKLDEIPGFRKIIFGDMPKR